MDTKLKEGITETLEILNHIDKIYTEKLPQKFLDFLNKNKSETYISKIDLSKKLTDLNLQEETKNLLGIMYLKYWSNEEEKNKYLSLLNENERKHQEYLNEKYNSDNLFKNEIGPNENIQETVTNEVALVRYNESLFKKIWNKILNLFKKQK